MLEARDIRGEAMVEFAEGVLDAAFAVLSSGAALRVYAWTGLIVMALGSAALAVRARADAEVVAEFPIIQVVAGQLYPAGHSVKQSQESTRFFRIGFATTSKSTMTMNQLYR